MISRSYEYDFPDELFEEDHLDAVNNILTNNSNDFDEDELRTFIGIILVIITIVTIIPLEPSRIRNNTIVS